MKFLMCYLLSGLKKTVRNSQNAIKEDPPKASQTQKIVFRRGASPQTPHQGFALDPQGGLSGPLDSSPNLSPPPPSTLKSGSGPDICKNCSSKMHMLHVTFDTLSQCHIYRNTAKISIVQLFCFCCVGVLRLFYTSPVISGYPHCSWASLLGSLQVLSAHSFANN